MPNSKIENSSQVTDALIEASGGWTTNGNAIAAPNNKIGSTVDSGVEIITNNELRAGFTKEGYFFLSEKSSQGFNRQFHVMKSLETVDSAPQSLFFLELLDRHVFKFNVCINYISADDENFGSFQRAIIARRSGPDIKSSKETGNYTERVGNKNIDVFWSIEGSQVHLKVKGLDNQATYFNASVNFFGA